MGHTIVFGTLVAVASFVSAPYDDGQEQQPPPEPVTADGGWDDWGDAAKQTYEVLGAPL